MKKILYLTFLMTIVTFVGCKNGKKAENPFLSEFKTPYQVPSFDKIDTSDYLPAFIEGMKQQKEEINAIINNPEAPTFENTIIPFDRSGVVLTRVSKVFYNLTEANTSDQLQALARKIDPMVTQHEDEIYMNPGLFKKIKVLFEKRHQINLDSQQVRVIEKYYHDFEKRGANLPADKQEELKKINSELSTLSLTFGDNVLAETNKNFKLVIDNKKDLDGLPKGVIDAASETAKEMKLDGKWVFTLAKPSMIPFLQFAKNRALREKIYRGYFMRGDNNNANDNKVTVAKIVKLRCQKAKLLGYNSYAAYVIDENMAKTPAQVNEFLAKLWSASLPVAKQEVAEMQKIIDQEGGKFKLAPWDWWYYAEKVRKAKYDMDENELKPYFTLDNVRNGMFFVASKLYGVTFAKRTDLPVYQKDVETYEVKESNGKSLGIIYMDYYPRDNKKGGAWCTDFQSSITLDGKKINAIMSLVFNVSKPTGNTPALLNWDETTTLFHEFGHSLHGLFTEGKYYRTAGVVPQDYVEMPSQFMENWASEPDVLRHYAKNYKTGEVIPERLIEKIQKSGQFNQGFETIEYLAASILDMDYHDITTPKEIDVDAFEKHSMDSIQLISEILPRYRSTYFSHIFDGGYAAGYYVYIWAAVLDADAFNAFKISGVLFNQDLAAKFRKYCLAKSGDDEGMVQYRKFRGQDPSIEPLLMKRGLIIEKGNKK
ncbi:MAG: M3 family metallopeptidase [Bacteroidota bacterium]|nr:M3 family metallopeptidase [Bacteroidota bacterium]